jgi:hypothetical protein
MEQQELPAHQEHIAYHEHVAGESDVDINRAVLHLATERPEWIPVLRAAIEAARMAEPYGGEFAGSWAIAQLKDDAGKQLWVPGLRVLVTYGLIEKAGPSTRGGRRAYYRMPRRLAIGSALQELDERLSLAAGQPGNGAEGQGSLSGP